MLPILIQTPSFILYSYPLLMGLGWGLAYQIFFSKYPKSESIKIAHLLFWGIFIFSWIGSKLLFLWTAPDAILKNSNPLSFWVGGGFVFYGGFLGALTFIFLFKIFFKGLTLNHLSPLIPSLIFGHAIGRLGCFLAGCCFGKITDVFWGIQYHGHLRHPTQLYESIFLFLLGSFILKKDMTSTKSLQTYLVSYGVFRFLLEYLRDDMVRGLWGVMTPSQWISLLLILSFFLILTLKKLRA